MITLSTIISLGILLMSIILHELAHGVIADRLGDDTARRLGRLSLNPLVHIDVLGSIIVPGLLVMMNAGFIIGWAKPVPVSPSRFRRPSYDMMLVALAGPLTNLTIALVCSYFLRFHLAPSFLLDSIQYAVIINVLLAVFNLIPVPPLDGSRILAHFLPPSARLRYYALERFGLLIVFLLVYFNIVRIWLSWIGFPIIRFLLS